MFEEYAIGIDLGGTKIEMALISHEGKALHSTKIPTNTAGGYKAIEDDICKIVADLKIAAKNRVFGIGIGAPGQINAKEGSVLFAPNLKWNNVPIRHNLESRLNLPVIITNDVRAATWGEWLHGAGKDCQDLVCLFVGTGIGSGIVSGGKMLQGFNNSAGELGHTIIQMDGPLCTCGSRGCLEAFASGWALAKKAKELILKNPMSGQKLLKKANGSVEDITTKMVVEAYLEQDSIATEIIQTMTEALTVGCINIANSLNPEKIILGGGVMTNLKDVIEPINQGIKKYALKSASANLQILPAKLTKDAGSIGAGTLAWKEFKK